MNELFEKVDHEPSPLVESDRGGVWRAAQALTGKERKGLANKKRF